MKDMKDTERRRPLPDAEADGVIEGRNAVIEALRTPPRPGRRASWWWRPTGGSWTT